MHGGGAAAAIAAAEEPIATADRNAADRSFGLQVVDVQGQAANENGGDLNRRQSNGGRRDGTRAATASQVRALNAIADRQKLDLSRLLAERFQINDPAAQTITEASSLIDELKEKAENGRGRRP